jgi:hypothetical protein
MAGTDERYTPIVWTERVIKALGPIGLDPTANESRTIPAFHHITYSQDCFQLDWAPLLSGHDTAFMNPPYSNTYPFLVRWASYLESGDLFEGVTLTLTGVIHNENLIGLEA